MAFPSNYGARSPHSGGRATEWKRGYSVAIVERIEPLPSEQIYGAWWKANVLADAKAAVARSGNAICAGSARNRDTVVPLAP
ncbi:MAG: hypothetical protein DMF44_01065 [Verrucomicrobia bacterium]|nr:MAG: hypothetical protein DMF44_01065 [Verrucomicrobiota bacterium]